MNFEKIHDVVILMQNSSRGNNLTKILSERLDYYYIVDLIPVLQYLNNFFPDLVYMYIKELVKQNPDRFTYLIDYQKIKYL